MSESKFGPIIDPLNTVFGDEVFGHWHTGGGCTAIEAHLEGDLTVMITDNPHLPKGEEAYITDMPTRVAGGGDDQYGYCVGVYGDEGCELLSMEFCSNVTTLPVLVTQLLIESVRERLRRSYR